MINVAQSRIYSQMQILIYHHNQHFSSSDIFKTPRTAKQKDLFKSRRGRGFFSGQYTELVDFTPN